MQTIEKTAGQVIAGDTRASVEAVDQAVASLATLCASIIEVSTASNMPVGTAQAALANAGASLNSMIASRADIAAATRELTAIQRKSNLEKMDFGCPGDRRTSGSLTDHPVLQSSE
ncbi:hypothetical protein [Erythrobacter sp. EC-HK427]|uniref:hypothetical protein n=1 Tax=Erythrobacter sp. EC-HK427 TaxID=2038396 RepID=UPI00125FF1FD|nr:hypothetical protein [Erythrobacter sp. EC-HK427]